MQKRILNVGVLGGGSFGTALGSAAARSGHNVTIYTKTFQTHNEINEHNLNLRFFPKEITLPKNLKASMDFLILIWSFTQFLFNNPLIFLSKIRTIFLKVYLT